MEGHQKVTEQPLSAREKLLQEKIVRLENQLQGYKSQIDILDDQRQKLEERTLDMESVLTKTKKELLKVKKEVLDKELAEIQLSEELKSMTLQSEEYKRLFVAESSKNRCGIDRLEALISNVDVKKYHEDALSRFESFKELISVIQEGFQAQVNMVLDKLSNAEDKLCGSLSNEEEKAFQKKIERKKNSTEHEGVDKEVEDSVGSASKPTVKSLQTQPSFSLSQANAGDKDNKPISITSATSEGVSKPVTSTSASHVFGDSANFGQLIFSSFKVPKGNALSGTQKKDSHKPFQGAGQRLFPESTKEAEGQDNDNQHFKAIIPLPDEIQVVTGEEGLEVLFTERAKLYRFDVDSGQWKERGVGEIKLLRHPTFDRGRVLMRREQIKKLCANHNITAGMELKPSVGSDRSWVWYTSADYADGEARPEKLAIKFKTPEIAEKFKDVFNDLKETSPSEHPIETKTTEEQKDTGCKLYEQLISTFAPGAWSCEVCYVNNKAEDSTFQLPGGKVLTTSQLFTIGRAEPREDRDTADDEIKLSPSKTSSPSKQAIPPPQKSSAPLSQSSLLTGLPFGTDTPSKFTFSLQVSSGSPPRKPKSPLSPTSPLSPGSPVHGDDDGPHFEPLIPLPEKVECRTGEEGQEVLFCERCKLFRYDSDTSQWKERGVGDIKILRNPNSERYRILMRRERVFKLCANHVISADMKLKGALSHRFCCVLVKTH